MSETKRKLRALKLYNTYELLRRFSDPGQDVACAYYPPEPRAVRGSSTVVFSPSHGTNPGGPWYEHDQKHFVGGIQESLPAAMAWASEKYGIKKWAVCPTDRSTRVPAVVRARALAAIRASR